MAKITYIEHNGTEHVVEVDPGLTVMEGARDNDIPGIEADCGGACACSTCHVYVHQGMELLSEAEDEEEDVLDKAFDVRENSRLGCQARIVKDGIIEVEITRESRKAWEDEH